MIPKTSKTTVLGVLVIVSAVLNGVISFMKTGTVENLGEIASIVLGGFGLVKAADSQ
jgi:hypothetical protein